MELYFKVTSDKLCREKKKENSTRGPNTAHERDAREHTKHRNAWKPHNSGRLATTCNELEKALSSRSHSFTA